MAARTSLDGDPGRRFFAINQEIHMKKLALILILAAAPAWSTPPDN